MKRAFILTLTVAFVVAMSGAVFAYDLDKPIDKLSTGVVDVLHSPMLLIEHPVESMENSDKPIGLFKGLIETPFKILTKAGHGVINIATFPVE